MHAIEDHLEVRPAQEALKSIEIKQLLHHLDVYLS
jgi:hypothetical protein